MTNDALVRIFFMGVATGKEESYGLSIKPRSSVTVRFDNCHITRKSDFALFSKTSQFPLARKLSENYFVISTPGSGVNDNNWKKHLSLATMIAKQIGVSLLASPQAHKANFQKYMEEKINGNLSFLVQASSIAPILQPAFILTDLYQNLIKNIRILLEGEILLKLPRYPLALLDTDEAQVLWAWLIKESPEKKDRELFLKMYTLSRLFNAQQRDVEIDLGTVDISSM